MWSLGLAPGVTCGDSLCPQDTSLTLNTTTSLPAPLWVLGPCGQDTNLALSQVMCKQIWENRISASVCYISEKPLGLRKITGNAAPMTASHKASLLFILLLKTMTSTHTLFALLAPNGIKHSEKLWTTLFLNSDQCSFKPSHLPSCYRRWLGEEVRLLCRLGFWLCLFRLRTDENMVLQPGTLHLCSWRRCTVL